MSEAKRFEFTLVGLAPAPDSRVYVLANQYETPIDPDEIGSSIMAMTFGSGGIDGDTLHGPDEWLVGLSACASGAVFACSMSGSVHRFDGAQWSVIPTVAEYGLNDIVAIDDRIAYAVGLKGEIIVVRDGLTAVSRPADGVSLNAIGGCSPDCLYAVGDAGRILRFDGGAWTSLPVMTNVNLLSVLCVSDDEVYVGATSGVFFRWDGRDWIDIDGGKATVSSIRKYRGDVYAAGGEDGVLVVDGLALRQVKKLGLRRLTVAHDRLFGCAAEFFCYFDGVHWEGANLAPRP